MHEIRFSCRAVVAAMALAVCVAAAPPTATSAPAPTYADLADLSDAADLVVHAKIAKAIAVPAERAANVAPGRARVYIEAETLGLIAGSAPLGESIRYLVDVPLDAKGKIPKLKKREVLLFARAVAGRPGELQLVGPNAQLDWNPALDARVKPILADLALRDAAPAITGIRDALSVAGTLAGESETQVFLGTRSGDPVSLTVIRRPGMAPTWGVSFGEIVDQAARPPERETLAWYRLACFLPGQLPAGANLAQDSASRSRAAEDYRFVMQQLGPCPRNLAAETLAAR
ncbi:hypothetical protein A6F68_00594 [Tsuneonella dongtanensis]|uniref:Uncharacterized protein n=1 Tax=Tsuneonella dongtanensis TaxID=692370 RepID=A0A1B2AAD9_9SPHN|nr:hypothetical protein [Tsuneonella dongtanensis]ANY19127.1 hypothetical protein A6F68_00594 [Tsuneonella dongtanensis]